MQVEFLAITLMFLPDAKLKRFLHFLLLLPNIKVQNSRVINATDSAEFDVFCSAGGANVLFHWRQWNIAHLCWNNILAHSNTKFHLLKLRTSRKAFDHPISWLQAISAFLGVRNLLWVKTGFEHCNKLEEAGILL